MLSLKQIFDEDDVIDVPLLRAGRHLNPRKGACLTELVAALTGDVWTDRPAQVHRTLARVARSVNDLTGDPGRLGLLTLLPGLIGTSSPRDRAESNRVRAAVVATLASASHAEAASWRPTRVRGRHPRPSARPRRPAPAAGPSGGPWWAWRCDRYATRAVRALAAEQYVGPSRDTALRELLLVCSAAARRARNQPVFVPQSTAELPQLSHLLVRTSLIHEPGCDWSSLVCTPLEPDQVRLLLGTSASPTAPTTPAKQAS